MTKVLIVDDEPFIRKALCMKLKKEGMEPLEAEDGEEAVQVALSEHPDLITLDLYMPKSDGCQTVNAIRQDSWGKTVPIILLSNSEGDIRLKELESDPHCQIRIKSNLSLDKMVDLIRETLK